MNLFDGTLIPLYNRFAHHSRYVDDLFGHIAGNDLIKGGVILAAFWGLWFVRRPLPDQAVARTTLLVTLIAAFLAVGSARALTLVLPFRARPLFAGAPFTQQPYDVQGILNALPNWSSFPSDHAALFFALTAGCFLVSRRLGVALIVYVSVFIMWPRLYLGIHYPTDILVGGLIGVVCVLGAVIAVRQLPPLQRLAAHTLVLIDRLNDRYPFISYAILFATCFETASLFNHMRGLVKVLTGHR